MTRSHSVLAVLKEGTAGRAGEWVWVGERGQNPDEDRRRGGGSWRGDSYVQRRQFTGVPISRCPLMVTLFYIKRAEAGGIFIGAFRMMSTVGGRGSP